MLFQRLQEASFEQLGFSPVLGPDISPSRLFGDAGMEGWDQIDGHPVWSFPSLSIFCDVRIFFMINVKEQEQTGQISSDECKVCTQVSDVHTYFYWHQY